MIGQLRLRTALLSLYKNNKLPKSIIIEAPQGMGKKTLIAWLSQELQIPFKIFGNKIEDIRSAFKTLENEYTEQFYVFENLEETKVGQNALLKLIEEPPKNIYVFLLSKNSINLLPTIQNRCIKYILSNYTKDELKQFNDDEQALAIFNVPEQLKMVKDLNLSELVGLVDKIIDKVDLASISNAFKLNSFIKVKDSSGKYNNEEGYDLDIFIRVLEYTLVNRYKESLDFKILSKYNNLQKALNQVKVNNKYFMDNFLLRNYMENKQWNI